MEDFAKDLGANELLAAARVLEAPAEEFVNDSTIEELWAMKAFEHAEIYFNLISSIDPKILRLTKIDGALYDDFRRTFPSLKLELVDEDEIKSPEAKAQWRAFCENYKETVEDYNYGTLLRLDCSRDYSAANSIVVPRVQFLAIELARNKEGSNDSIRKNFAPKKFKPRS